MTYTLPKITQWSFSLEVSNLRKFWTQTNTLVRLTAELTGFLRDLLCRVLRQSGTETVRPCYLPLLAGFQSNPRIGLNIFWNFHWNYSSYVSHSLSEFLGLKYEFNSDYSQCRVCPKFCSLSIFRKIVSFFNPQFHFGQIPLRPKLEFLLYQYCQWLNYQRLSW